MDDETDQHERFEEQLSRCLAAHARGGEAALERALAEHPEHAARLRRRVDDLARFGLLAPDEPEPPPERIGPHRVLARLGRGGMGEVFLAEDARSGARIAVKLARLPMTGEAGSEAAHLRERFAREVRAVTKLRHPDVVAIREAGEHGGRPWYAMDFVAGATVATLLARLRSRSLAPAELTVEHVRDALALELAPADERAGEPGEPGDGPATEPPPDVELDARTYVEWACQVVARVARAVDHAHGQGIVHRDLKPSNVLVRPDGRALLFDLGLAHLVDDPGLTRTGDLAGTPSYVAPEQVAGRRGGVDARTDVWGLGVTLFEMLTLRRPFEGEGEGAPRILRAILEDDPPALRDLHAELPRDLETVCLKALEKDPRRRYPSARALAEDLERLLSFRPVMARPVGWARRSARRLRRKPALASAVALAALVLAGTPIGLLVANAAIRAQARRAERAAEDAVRQAAARERVVDHLVDLFRSERTAVDPEVLDDTVDRVLGGAGEDALARASLLEAAGRVFHNMGQHARALPLLDRAFALRQSELAESGEAPVEVLRTLSEVHLALGRASTARALAERALSGLVAEGAGGIERGRLALSVRLACARAARGAGDPEAAAAHLDAARELVARDGAASEDRARVAHESGRAAADAGDLARAERELARAIELGSRAWMPDARAIAALCAERAEVLQRSGEAEQARAAEERTARIRIALDRPLGAPAPALDLEPPWLAEYEATFQDGVTALQAGAPAAAVERFERCLELRPRSGVCAYNIACGHALAGDAPAAWPWLEQAVRWDFGHTPQGRETILRDPDLAPLRRSRRFEDLMRTVEAREREVAAALARPVVVEPAADGGWVVLLHDNGADARAVVDGPWGAAARALDLGVFAASAPRPAADEPGAGFEWFEHVSIFARAPWFTEDELLPHVRRFLREHPGAAGRARLAGEGAGATVAFDLALRAPGLWSGVLLRDAPLLLAGNERRLLVAAALGLRVRLVLDAERPVPGWPSTAAYATALRSWLAGEGITDAVAVEVRSAPGSVGARAAQLREELAALGR